VFSSIVLQHVPDRPAIERYVAEFCRVVRPGGLVMFQLPGHLPDAVAALRGPAAVRSARRERWLLRFYGPKFKMFELSLVPSTLKGKVLAPFRRSTRR
jgi:hypothetical protein